LTPATTRVWAQKWEDKKFNLGRDLTPRHRLQFSQSRKELLQISSSNDDNHEFMISDPRSNNNFQNAADDTSYKDNTDRGHYSVDNIIDPNMKRFVV